MPLWRRKRWARGDPEGVAAAAAMLAQSRRSHAETVEKVIKPLREIRKKNQVSETVATLRREWLRGS